MIVHFAIRNLRLQGAKCRSNKLHLSSSISTELSLTLFKWIRATEKKQTKFNDNFTGIFKCYAK